MLTSFGEYLTVDLQLRESTATLHILKVRQFLEYLGSDALDVRACDIRDYLKTKKNTPCDYKNVLSALKRFYRDYLKAPDLVESFEFPKKPLQPKIIPTKKELSRFYKVLKNPRDRAIFLLYASSGLRRSEILDLTRGSIDLAKRAIIPSKERNASKNTWVSFFNVEAERELKKYLKTYDGERVFPISKRQLLRIFKNASESSGVKITSQRLREWFCEEMGNKGVPDRYIDAFCGRTPSSILAKRYTDYSPEKLRKVYKKARLKVLCG